MVNTGVIPSAALRQNLITLGKTRSGKSSKLRVFAEQLLDAAQPVCILDPKGDWWGLKSSADGKKAGYPIVIFGGEHADVPINEHSGAHVAEIIATGNRPALIDLGGWMVGARTRFFIEFASAFFRLARGARHLIIDEVHNFAPQGRIMDPDAGKMLHWANRLASEGSGKGITLYAASQRPQKVHKDFVTSCETLVACKVIHKLDRDAIKDWIDGCADPTKGREVIADLAQLKKPEAWVWCPEVDFGPKRLTFPMFRTYDSFKPQAADAGKLKGWAEVDLEEVKAKLVSVVKEAEANDPRKLKARIAELERQTKTPTTAAAAPTYPDQRAEVAELRQAIQFRDQIIHDLDSRIGKVAALVNLGGQTIPPLPAVSAPVTRRQASPAPQKPRGNGHVEPQHADGTVLSQAGPRKCLTAIAQYPDGVNKNQLCALTQYAERSVQNHVSALRVAGLVTPSWPMTATDAGLRELGSNYTQLPTGEDLYRHWTGILDAGPRTVLETIWQTGAAGISKADLVAGTHYAERSIQNHVSALRTRRLIVKRGGKFVAVPELFG